MTNNLIWDLDSIFSGGSRSTELAKFIKQMEQELTDATQAGLPDTLTTENQTLWIEIAQRYYNISAQFEHASSFIECLTAQDVDDEPAVVLAARLGEQYARLENLWTQFGAKAAQFPDEDWNHLLESPDLKPVAFSLNEERTQARQKMAPEIEALTSELAADGYHAWDQLYNVAAGLKQVDFEEDGKTEKRSLGQLQNTFEDDPDRGVRERAFGAYEAAWTELAPVAALALNYQAGFRLTLYRHRKWASVLQEPLFNNRLSAQTLDTMWGVIADKSDRLLDFFAAKAKLLGLDGLKWYDTAAPVGNLSGKMSYAEAGDFVINNIAPLSEDIADFCRMAIDKRWVEAEDRSGKGAGAFCTGFPLTGQTRIFMTFGGSYAGMSTLAHELGHSYHNWVMRDLPYGAQHYSMGVAETASTFNELAVTDAYLKTISDEQEKLSLLGRKLDDAVAFLMNIRARYDFERAFFAERANGQLSVDELSELMLNAQKTAYHNGLTDDGYFPLFWASKLHFYITRSPFYNFPYTFGYLFSSGVYTQALAEGPTFSQKYAALLRDTGSMDTETLAQTHLGVDLTKPDFWEITIDRILADVGEFVQLADKFAPRG